MDIDGIEIKWFGHATFMIAGEKTIYTDPYVLAGNMKPADIILISHEHFDHFDRAKIKMLRSAKTVVVAPPACASGLEGSFKLVREGDKISIDGVNITAVPAYNVNKFRMGKIPFHAKGEGVGYLIEMSGKKIYFAGDTDFIEEMKKLRPDIALLPIGGVYTMTLEEAANAANAMKPKYVIPMHYNTLKETKVDPLEFAKKVDKSIKVIINPQ